MNDVVKPIIKLEIRYIFKLLNQSKYWSHFVIILQRRFLPVPKTVRH